MRLFWAYVRMMPVLHARESIHSINESIYAQGYMDKDKAEAFISDLERLAARAHEREGRAEQIARPQSMEEMMVLLGQSSTNMGSEPS
jgi:hypothetical protein